MDSLRVKKLYVRFFDVDWNPLARAAQPVAAAEFKDTIPSHIEIVPTIFITNTTFRSAPPQAIPQLARSILVKVKTMAELCKIGPIHEIQIDCDWTAATKKNYFQFLSTMRDSLHLESMLLSTTIRLHQLAYRSTTGVPPADRGVLMFYNMGDVEKESTKNSILDLKVGQYYLERSTDYPIHLDVALPLFRWGVQLRYAKVVNLIHGMNRSDLSDIGSFQSIGNDLFKVLKSRYVRSVYLYTGDLVRLEEVSLKDLFDAVELVKGYVKADTITVAFYHLDTDTPERFRHEDLRNLLSSFSR